jgi:PKHD-type hydroxylase
MRQHAYWFLKDFYSLHEIEDIVTFFERNHNTELTDHPAENIAKTAKVKLIDWYKIKHLLERAHQAAKYLNATEIGYDLYDMTDYHCANYNVYDSKAQGKYDWHVDASPDHAPADIKLTVIINVSIEPYAGGQFEIFRQGVMPVNELDSPGTVIVFPGFWNHRVLPVTQGIRRTVSFWIDGPKFR